MNDLSSLLAFALVPADDPYLLTGPGAGPLAAALSYHPRSQAPRPLAGPVAGPARPASSRDRPRLGHHAALRPALAQRLSGTRPRGLAAPQGEGGRPQTDRRPGTPAATLGDRGAGRVRPGPGQLDLRRTGRPPLQDQGRAR